MATKVRVTGMCAGAAVVFGLGFATGLAAVADAASPAQVCQANKNKEAGKYALCRHMAEGKYALLGDAAALTAALEKCAAKYTAKWPMLESRADGVCPSTGDEAAIQATVDRATANIATALAGGSLSDCDADLQACDGDRQACNTDLQTCQGDVQTCQYAVQQCHQDWYNQLLGCQYAVNNWQIAYMRSAQEAAICRAGPDAGPLQTGQTQCWDASGALMPCAGTGQDGELQAGIARAYRDNGDGTIMDPNTGLRWEKLSDDGSIHDKDNRYSWETAFSKIASLNSENFAGSVYWRLPNRSELDTLVVLNPTGTSVPSAFDSGCTPGCTIATCSCTQPEAYWSSSTFQYDPQLAWFVYFVGGSVNATYKTESMHVRAVSRYDGPPPCYNY